MKQILKILNLLFVLILIGSIFFHCFFKDKKENIELPKEFTLPEDVILQFDDNYLDCKQISDSEIYCLVKDIRKV